MILSSFDRSFPHCTTAASYRGSDQLSAFISAFGINLMLNHNFHRIPVCCKMQPRHCGCAQNFSLIYMHALYKTVCLHQFWKHFLGLHVNCQEALLTLTRTPEEAQNFLADVKCGCRQPLRP